MSNVTLIIAAVVAILAVVGLFLLLRKPKQRVSLSEPAPLARPAAPAAPKPAPEKPGAEKLVAEKPVAAKPVATKPAAAKPAPKPKPVAKEGHGLADSAAAAVLDIATPVVGVDAHPDMPSDDLARIKGLGPKAKAVLAGIGIHRFDQIASLDAARAAEVDEQLGAFKGRLFRDRWIDQARYLEQGDVAGFEKEFGKLG